MANRGTHKRRTAARKARQAAAYETFTTNLRKSQNAHVKVPPKFDMLTQRSKFAVMAFVAGVMGRRP